MPQNKNAFYDIHVFCCTNRRSDCHPRGCCAAKNSENLRNYMKDQCKKYCTSKKIRINSSGCLDRCEEGPVMVFYPEGIWYKYSSKDDIDKILSNHIDKGSVAKELQI